MTTSRKWTMRKMTLELGQMLVMRDAGCDTRGVPPCLCNVLCGLSMHGLVVLVRKLALSGATVVAALDMEVEP
jgi:hypothetical protein